MRLATGPVDLQSAGKDCQLAINNAGANGVTQLLREGVPQLLLPLHAEQQMFARCAQATGACLIQPLDSNNSDSWRDALKAAVDPAGAQNKAAVQFAENQASSNPTVRVEDLLCQLE
jgi:UDP:flavonoid glycosyltransferase YjiC (YdhE family)